MIEIGQVVNSKDRIENQPNNDYGCKCRCNLTGSQWLDQKQQDDDGAGHTDDGAGSDVGLDDIETLDCAEDGLRRGENAIGHDERDAGHTYDFKKATEEGAGFYAGADSAARALEVGGEVAFHSDHGEFFGVALDDVGLEWSSVISYCEQEFFLFSFLLFFDSGKTNVSREERVEGESAALAFIIRVQDDEDVFDADHEREGPDDEGESAKEVVIGGVVGKS